MSTNKVEITFNTKDFREWFRKALMEKTGIELPEEAPQELLDALKESEMRIIPDWMRVL